MHSADRSVLVCQTHGFRLVTRHIVVNFDLRHRMCAGLGAAAVLRWVVVIGVTAQGEAFTWR